MSKKVLVIGSGGREHAIAWKLSQSAKIQKIFVAPGSWAIGQVSEDVNLLPDLDVKNHEKVIEFCRKNLVDLVVVGPEDPLSRGIADDLEDAGIKTFGPRRIAAQIESDKSWSKNFMQKKGIPTARYGVFNSAKEAKNFVLNADFKAWVVKASGLAAGKGVVVAQSNEEACEAIDDILGSKKFGSAGETLVVEELLQGEEVSVLAFCDGRTIKPMLPAQDHKRIFDFDQGPNTGGMGAYCPCPLLNKSNLQMVQDEILLKTLQGFVEDNIKFVGVLYAGLMLTKEGPKVLEFNARFGDPETEVILPLLQSDLYDIFWACCNGTLDKVQINWKENVFSVGVVMASKGYPESSSKGQVITGLDQVLQEQVFHCGTALNSQNQLTTNGGRVLIVVSLHEKLLNASIQATNCCLNKIKFEGAQCRKDIAHKGLATSILSSGRLTYKQSGVDITAGNDLVDFIKPAAKSTTRMGVLGGLGGFGGLFSTKLAGFEDPILVSGTDGVGTKLKIAQKMNKHNTIGIDLVAMCVNDVLANGAEPLFFLDYFACGKLDVKTAKEVVEGIAEGCNLAGCGLIGGETAEMPDMYPPGDYDLAGFTVGAVERPKLIPLTKEIQEGDLIIGLPSSGVHSNGFSLVRKVLELTNLQYSDRAPFNPSKTLGEELLTPTKIYVKTVLPAIKQSKIKALAHITGGGLIENIPRVLPEDLAVKLDATTWNIPPVFSWLATRGGISQNELLRTFNLGLGAIVVVSPENSDFVLESFKKTEPACSIVGRITSKGHVQVQVDNFEEVFAVKMRSFIPEIVCKKPAKRVAVLISGTGTNLQALIDATASGGSCHELAEIVVVLSNKPGVEGLNKAKKAGLPTKVLSHLDYKSREDFDRAMSKELQSLQVDLVCLAGFMRILSGEFTRLWKGKLINIHPSLLPSFKGTHAQKQALDAGVKVSGCTVHFVEEDIDSGAIIVQEAVPIFDGDSEDVLIERIKVAEHQAFPKALKLVAQGLVQDK